ncbi:MAG: proline hydroxylase [Paraburkholderia sp.]|nr:MAG: proline hydroxylase [Paraburkholderia sp.]
MDQTTRFEPERTPASPDAGCIRRDYPEPAGSIAQRVAAIDWPCIEENLDRYGCATVPQLLTVAECEALTAGYTQGDLYRSRVVMARHGFGRGEYQYFAYPLPDLVGSLRATLYPHLVPVANRWNALMHLDTRYPPAHDAFLRRCHAAGQLRPTPLILQYATGDYNCLHQDLYGEHVFPIQVAILLSAPARDFTGGEFVLTEQRPRMQSRVEVVPLAQGDAVIFAVNERPVQGTRGAYRVKLRHGVSRLRSGRRHTLGVIFHDAQ